MWAVSMRREETGIHPWAPRRHVDFLSLRVGLEVWGGGLWRGDGVEIVMVGWWEWRWWCGCRLVCSVSVCRGETGIHPWAPRRHVDF